MYTLLVTMHGSVIVMNPEGQQWFVFADWTEAINIITNNLSECEKFRVKTFEEYFIYET